MVKLMQGDCLELLKNIPDNSVDMVLADPPYGTTHCQWDKRIPFEPMWEQLRRVTKDNTAILLFAQQPFQTDLINSNRKMFRYEIIWQKTQIAGFLNAKRMPLRTHENILVFYRRLPVYNPQKHQLSEEYIKQHLVPIGRKRIASVNRAKQYGKYNAYLYTDTGERYPTDVIKFSSWNGVLFGKDIKAVKHSTQKPVPLLEYLIRTYSNEGGTVLDFCMGSGSTGVACINTGRDFIGMELSEEYFEIAKNRIAEAENGRRS